jgi:hypothetical protein
MTSESAIFNNNIWLPFEINKNKLQCPQQIAENNDADIW